MPKELHEITKFTTGTITVPDEKDIPEDAASYSLNIDSVTEGGKLKGVPGDFYLVNDGGFAASGTAETVDAQVMAMINRDGYHDLVYFEWWCYDVLIGSELVRMMPENFLLEIKLDED